MTELQSEFIDKLVDKYTSHLIEVEKFDALIKVVENSLNDHSDLWITATASLGAAIIGAAIGAIATGYINYKVDKRLSAQKLEEERKRVDEKEKREKEEKVYIGISYLFNDLNMLFSLKKTIIEDIKKGVIQQYPHSSMLIKEYLSSLNFIAFYLFKYFFVISQTIFIQEQISRKLDERNALFEENFLQNRNQLKELIPSNTSQLLYIIDDALSSMILSIKLLVHYLEENKLRTAPISIVKIPQAILPAENLLAGRGFDDLIEKVKHITLFEPQESPSPPSPTPGTP